MQGETIKSDFILWIVMKADAHFVLGPIYMRNSNRFEISPQFELNLGSGQSPYSVYMENAMFNSNRGETQLACLDWFEMSPRFENTM